YTLFTKLVELGCHIAMQQEMLVLLAAVLVHAAAGVTVSLVAKVKGIMLAIVRQFTPNSGQNTVNSRRPLLASTRLEMLDRHPYRDARATVIAIGAIGECAAATESKTNQFAVDARVDEVTGGRHLRAGRLIREIAAGIGRRRVKLQRCERKVVQLAHDSISGPLFHPAGAAVECINSDKCTANV